LPTKSPEVFDSRGEQTSLLKINSFKLIFNGEVNAMKDYDVIVVGSGARAIQNLQEPQ
jgi:hypothetical protein